MTYTENKDPLNLPGNHQEKFNEAYGDNYVAALYCGFKHIPKPVSGEWQHGWIIPERNIHPELVIGSDGLSINRKNKKYFVARSDQEQYLKSQGFHNVFAIGLPIIYVEKPKVKRIKGSLLIMPVHSLSDTQENWNDEEYASYIDTISHNFSEIVLCLHKSCLDKGNWITAFKKRNFKVILGADPDDSNSYARLAVLFSRFEFVTSNDFGSHIAYAAYFGAKVSVAGPPPKFERKDYGKTIFYSNAPEALDIIEKWNKEDFYKKSYRFLYLEPQEGNQLIEWASWQLGESEKKDPKELIELFGWTLYERMSFKKNQYIRLIKKTINK